MQTQVLDGILSLFQLKGYVKRVLWTLPTLSKHSPFFRKVENLGAERHAAPVPFIEYTLWTVWFLEAYIMDMI